MSVQDRCMVCAGRTIGSEIFLNTLDGLETVLVSVQDWCMVCARHTIGSEIILDTPDRTLGNEAQVKARSV